MSRNSINHKFLRQRCKAKQRGIEWLLTFDEWWAIWTESGHWQERGHNFGCYVMARHGDVGPYAVGNVSIITHSQNISDAPRPPRDLPRGVYHNGPGFAAKRSIRGKHVHLGTFPTPEEAHAAYLRVA